MKNRIMMSDNMSIIQIAVENEALKRLIKVLIVQLVTTCYYNCIVGQMYMFN